MSTKKRPQGPAYAYMQISRNTLCPTLSNNSYKFKGHASMPVTAFTGTATCTVNPDIIKS